MERYSFMLLRRDIYLSAHIEQKADHLVRGFYYLGSGLDLSLIKLQVDNRVGHLIQGKTGMRFTITRAFAGVRLNVQLRDFLRHAVQGFNTLGNARSTASKC